MQHRTKLTENQDAEWRRGYVALLMIAKVMWAVLTVLISTRWLDATFLISVPRANEATGRFVRELGCLLHISMQKAAFFILSFAVFFALFSCNICCYIKGIRKANARNASIVWRTLQIQSSRRKQTSRFVPATLEGTCIMHYILVWLLSSDCKGAPFERR